MEHYLSDSIAGVKAVCPPFCRAVRRIVVPISPARGVILVLSLLVLVASPPGVLGAESPVESTYVVRRGDTLALIAERTGVSMSTLASANGLGSTNLIYVGQVLVVPQSATVSTGDSSASVTAPADTAELSEATPDSATTVYIVKKGDTLTKIAARYGTTVKALMAANGISNPDRIYVGQMLVVRGGKTTPPKPAPAPTAGRWIDINLSTQRLTAYQGKTAVISTLVSTGVAGRRTPVGRFSVRRKLRAQTMSGPGYYLPNVPYVMYFAGANAIHGTYWHKNFGHPMSHGCVNLPTPAAKWVYNWASIGTLVVTHY